MVLGFDNTGLLIAGIFGTLVLKPHQLNALGRSCGRALGLAVGYLSNLREEIENSKHKSEFMSIHNEVQESLSTLNAIQYQVKRGTRIMPSEIGSGQSVLKQDKSPTRVDAKSEKETNVEQIPISAEMTGRAKKGSVKYGSEIMLDAMLEEKIAHQAKQFMEQKSPDIV